MVPRARGAGPSAFDRRLDEQADKASQDRREQRHDDVGTCLVVPVYDRPDNATQGNDEEDDEPGHQRFHNQLTLARSGWSTA